MAKKKLLVLSSTFPRWKHDSTPPFVFELAKKLQKDFEVCVLAPHYPKALKNETWEDMKIIRFKYFFSPFEKLALNGGIISALKKNPLNYLLIPFFIIAEFMAIKKVIKKYKPDVIHAHWIIPQGLLLSLTNTNTPWLITSHGSDIWAFRQPIMIALKKIALKKAAAITVVSQALKNEIERKIIKNKKIEVMSMGVDHNNFSPKKYSEKLRKKHKHMLLYVGRLSKEKGLEYLIKAMPNVLKQFPDVQLLVIGGGPLKFELDKLINNLGVEKNINMLGSIPNSDLPSYYATADIFIMPSKSEGLPVTLMEAMSSSAIVLATDLEGNKDLIQHRLNGFLCQPKNHDDIAKNIIEILNNGELNKVRDAARKIILEKFSWDIIANKYKKTLSEIIK